MKTLALLRHGKSSWNDPKLSDFDRPLKMRGRTASEIIGAEMRRRKLAFDLVLASPAKRVVETITHVENGYGKSLRPSFDPEIYEASTPSLLKIVRAFDDKASSILLVGHNPGLQALTMSLAAKDDALYWSVGEDYPTAALALIELPVRNWVDVRQGLGRIGAFIKPRGLTDECA